MGSYADDALFMSRNNIEYVELISDDGKSKVMVIPAWQGRVMTTSAAGDEGDSYGWINYSFIKKRQIDLQFNPVGGEERFWLGPEGGVFSLYFRQGEKQIYKKLFKFYSKIILWQRYASWLRAYRPCIHSQWSVS